MNIIFWIIQSLVALTFLYSGINKSIYSERHLVAVGQTGVEGLPAAEIKFIGIIEILGAFGLILPGFLNTLPVITPLTAIGFAIIMLLAVRIHLIRKEPKNVFTNGVLFVLCLLIAWYRF
ncbi:DoxX family protein [Mucilaginibacter aquariorum]|uniref:DoxX family protein n=1 Tax=Mucilaginibacter aquariorum TaxID=2967225 RepID=A0ABT1SXV0_9SPHI|nr:DoxX family protein [Mucilaginibacter aquariorum]MCQ6957169.1 DoxX family protein [Mucilaginibacter aquariorum]